MSEDEILASTDEPDPEYVDNTPAAPDDIEDDPEPMQAGEVAGEVDAEAEVAGGTEP